jgi:hypothetical protein
LKIGCTHYEKKNMSFYTILHWEADGWIDGMEAIIAAALSFEFVSSRAVSQQKILVG